MSAGGIPGAWAIRPENILTEEDEIRWVERARQGDTEAVAWLYRRYAPAVYRYLYYRLGDIEVAQEMTSEVFLRVLEALPRYRTRGRPFLAWLYRIAGARVQDYYRRHRRWIQEPFPPKMSSVSSSPEEEAEAHLTAAELQRALAHLTPIQQQVIVLRFVEGLSHSEVAHIIGRSEGAVRMLQYRPLEALRRLLAKVVSREQGKH